MTRYTREEMDWSAASPEPDVLASVSVSVTVQLLSGEILTLPHSPHQFLYSLKQKLHEYCPLWKPHLLELYQQDAEGEFIPCSPLTKGIREGDHFYLIVKEPLPSSY